MMDLMTEADKTIQDLRAVRERLFNTGWTKLEMGDGDGPNCIVGAVTYVQDLRAVRERLFNTGWTKLEMGDGDGPNCIVGAVTYERAFGQTMSVLAHCINVEVPATMGSCYRLQYFNDQIETTFDDVVDLIDRSIKFLETEQ